jgi:GABA permease
VPVRAILLGTVIGYIAVVMAYVSPDHVFSFLIDSYGAVALFVYLLIAISQVRLRRRLEREAPERLAIRMWAFPWLSYLTIAGMAAVTLAMAFIGDTRSEFFVSLLSLAVVLVAYQARRRTGAPQTRETRTRARTPALE